MTTIEEAGYYYYRALYKSQAAYRDIEELEEYLHSMRIEFYKRYAAYKAINTEAAAAIAIREQPRRWPNRTTEPTTMRDSAAIRMDIGPAIRAVSDLDDDIRKLETHLRSLRKAMIPIAQDVNQTSDTYFRLVQAEKDGAS
jgi:hypothetical protein